MRISKSAIDSILHLQIEDFKTLRVEMFVKFKLRWQLSIALIALSASIFPFLMESADSIRFIGLITIPALFYIFTLLSASLWYQAMHMGIYIDKYIRIYISKLVYFPKNEPKLVIGAILGWEEYVNTVEGSACRKITIILFKRLLEYIPFLGIALGCLIIFFLSNYKDSLLLNIAIFEAALFLPLLAGLLYFIYTTEKYWIERMGDYALDTRF